MTTSKNNGSMEEIDRIIDHLRRLVSKEKSGEKSILRQGFEALAGQRTFSKPQMRSVFSNVSETGRTEINGSVSQMWLFFQDGLSKVTMAYDALPLEKRVLPLLNAIVFSRWNAENFPKILEFRTPESVPSYPAPINQLSDFRVVPAYIEQSVMPALKKALAGHLEIDVAALDKTVAEREEALICSGVPGYEALMPIKEWPSGKKKPSQAGGCLEVKGL